MRYRGHYATGLHLIQEWIEFMLCLAYKALHNMAPLYLTQYLSQKNVPLGNYGVVHSSPWLLPLSVLHMSQLISNPGVGTLILGHAREVLR